MIVVIDTNVLLQLFGAKSSLRALKDALIRGRVELAVSTPVLLEYEEVVLRSSGAARWKDMVRAFEVMSLLHGSSLCLRRSSGLRGITIAKVLKPQLALAGRVCLKMTDTKLCGKLSNCQRLE